MTTRKRRNKEAVKSEEEMSPPLPPSEGSKVTEESSTPADGAEDTSAAASLESPADGGVRKSSRLSHKPARSVSELMKPASRSFVKDQMKTVPRKVKAEKEKTDTSQNSAEAQGPGKDQAAQADGGSGALTSKTSDGTEPSALREEDAKCIMRRKKPKRKAVESAEAVLGVAASSSENGALTGAERRSSGEAVAEQEVKTIGQQTTETVAVKLPLLKTAATSTPLLALSGHEQAVKKIKLSPLSASPLREEIKKDPGSETALPLQQKLVIPPGSDILSQIQGLKPGQTIAIVTKDQLKQNNNSADVAYRTVAVPKVVSQKSVPAPVSPSSPGPEAVPKPSTSTAAANASSPIKVDPNCKVKVTQMQGDAAKGLPPKLCITWPVGGGKTLIFHIQNYEASLFSPSTTKEEIAADRVLCGVSAVVKPSLLAIPSMPQFLFSQLPALTGVTFYGRSATASSSVCVTGSLAAVNRAVTLLTQLEKLFPPEYKSLTPSAGQDTVVSSAPAAALEREVDQKAAPLSPPGTSSAAFCTPTCWPQLSPTPSGADRFSQSHSVILDNSPVPTTQDFVCSQCSQVFPSSSDCENHKRNAHSEECKVCVQCKKTFPGPAQLAQHLQAAHSKRFPCSVCGKPFSERRYMVTHLKRHAGVKNHVCLVCGWRFFERTKLRWHMETHKALKDRKLPYKCDTCSKQFFNKATLMDHWNVHTGRKPFACTKCPASFAHRIGLKRHQLVHSSTSPLFSCSVCDRGFHTRSKLTAHMTRHTGLGKHRCPRCQKVFTVANSLKRHQLHCHKTETPELGEEAGGDFMCGVCGAHFQQLAEAEVHALSHNALTYVDGVTLEEGCQVVNAEESVAMGTSSQEVHVATSALASLTEEMSRERSGPHLTPLQTGPGSQPSVLTAQSSGSSPPSQSGTTSATPGQGLLGGGAVQVLADGDPGSQTPRFLSSGRGCSMSESSESNSAGLSRLPGTVELVTLTPGFGAGREEERLNVLSLPAAGGSLPLPDNGPGTSLAASGRSEQGVLESGGRGAHCVGSSESSVAPCQGPSTGAVAVTAESDKLATHAGVAVSGVRGGNPVSSRVSVQEVLNDPRLEGAVQLCLFQEGKVLATTLSQP